MNENIVISPCISVCKTDPLTGLCYGCGRTDEDKKLWKLPETSNNWKKENLLKTRNLLNGWQLEAFDKSYENKKRNGMSLIRERKTDSKN